MTADLKNEKIIMKISLNKRIIMAIAEDSKGNFLNSQLCHK